MRSIAILLALTLGGSWALVQALPEGNVHAESRTVRTREIQSISIDGGRGLPMAELREAMSSKIGGIVDTATLAQDRATLQAALSARGYLAATVADPIVTYGPSGGVFIVFDVERGPLYHVRTITVTGPHAKAMLVTLSAGDEAIDARLQRVRQGAQDSLPERSKNAGVELVVIPDPIEPVVDVRLVTR